MLLEELLYCTIFFGLPLVGLIGMVITKLLKMAGLNSSKVKAKSEVQYKHLHSLKEGLILKEVLRKRKRYLSQLTFENSKNRVRIPLRFNRLKQKAHPRAGP